MADLPECLPVPPSMRRLTFREVTYCIERRADHLWHEHIALFDDETGELRYDFCSLGAHDSWPYHERVNQ